MVFAVCISGSTSRLIYVILQVQIQSQTRYSELDTRDWRSKSSQFSSPADDRSWDALRENREFGGRQEQLSSQFARTQISPTQGVILNLVPFVLFPEYIQHLL